MTDKELIVHYKKTFGRKMTAKEKKWIIAAAGSGYTFHEINRGIIRGIK